MGESLIQYLLTYNLYDYGSNYEVPIIYIIGDPDWHNRIVAEEYFNDVNAPYKQFIIIEDAGHVTMLDQPESFYSELSSALNSALF